MSENGELGAWSCPTLWDTMAYSLLAPLSIEFSRQEYWSGLRCPSPGDLTEPGIEPESPAFQADCLPSESPGNPYMSEVISHLKKKKSG